MRKHLRATVAALTLFAGSMHPAPAQAQMVVIDPAVLAQNVIEVARSLEQIHNQIRQIEQQAAMLAQNPLDLSPELSASIETAGTLFENAEALAFESDRLSSQIRELYPETFEAFDLDAIGDQTDRWLASDREAIERAMALQARATSVIDDTQARVGRALRSSSDAEGQTGAVQASNQLLAINASQLAELHALIAAQGRALEAERLERVSREARGREVQRRAFPSTRGETPAAARSAFAGE